MTHPETILLINPDWTGIQTQKQPQFKRIWQPLDLAIAAAMLEQEGYSVRILDNNIEHLSPQAIGRRADQCQKVFVTSTPYDRWQCPALDIGFFFRTIERIPRERLYIMGAHVTERPEAVLRQSRARLAILGEPEQTVLELARQDGSPDIPSGIPGIAWLEGDRLVCSAPRGFIHDLDRLPYPAYHLLNMDRYHYAFLGGNFAILEGSRGCPHRCSFCYLGMYGHRFRQKSLDRLVSETVYVRDRFHVTNIYFMDLEFALNRGFVRSFCRALIRHNLGIRWCCQTRVTDVDDDLLKLMRQAGCRLIHFGVEAGSPRILSRTGKGIRVSDCLKAVSLARKNRIRTALFMNFGFPDETPTDMASTTRLAVRLDPDYVAFHLIVPFPGTRLAEQIQLDPETFPAHLYPHYNFVHHDLRTLKSVLRRAYLRFYLRPSYLIRSIKDHTLPGFDQGRLFLRLLKG
ncbi:MAG: B12-binding domain-containing radical SAM protein [Deltaproteobacteria bacterium]|nr:B12-binding domain-containing radical SAM protein [Deltaproteobacteria bacterium]